MAAVRARVGGVSAAIIWALPAGNRDKVIRPNLFPYRSRATRLIGGRSKLPLRQPAQGFSSGQQTVHVIGGDLFGDVALQWSHLGKYAAEF